MTDANREGISIVFQELNLFPHLDVLANLFGPQQPRRYGIVARRRMRELAGPVLNEIGLTVDLNRAVGDLRLAERQLVEIARALLAESDILILDEPNSELNAEESERLFGLVHKLRDRGVAIVYVSHCLEEVLSIADVITVMRNGAIIDSWNRDDTTIGHVVAAMIGRRPAEATRKRSTAVGSGEPLQLRGVTVEGRLADIDLTAALGEIVGLAGLEGAGVTEVFDVVLGLQVPDAGDVIFPGGRPAPSSVHDAVRTGIAYVPADRLTDGLMLDQSLVDNIMLITAGVLGVLARPDLYQRSHTHRKNLRPCRSP